MVNLKRTITLNAPIDKVFAFIADPHNLPEIWSSMIEVRNVKANPKGGYDFEWAYKMAGMHFDGASEVVEFVKDKRVVTRSTKGIASKFTWVYESISNGTRLILDVEYTVPIPLLGKLAEAIIVKENEHEMDTLLANLKTRMEMHEPMPA